MWRWRYHQDRWGELQWTVQWHHLKMKYINHLQQNTWLCMHIWERTEEYYSQDQCKLHHKMLSVTWTLLLQFTKCEPNLRSIVTILCNIYCSQYICQQQYPYEAWEWGYCCSLQHFCHTLKVLYGRKLKHLKLQLCEFCTSSVNIHRFHRPSYEEKQSGNPVEFLGLACALATIV